MPDAPVVINNTPLVALASIGQLQLLQPLFGAVLVPNAVIAEFFAVERESRVALIAAEDWLIPTAVEDPTHTERYAGLDQGEAEVLAVAEEKGAALVIMDERRARRYARRLSIPVSGTLGVLLLAKERGLVDAVAPLIAQLIESGLYLADDVVRQALLIAGE
jgi:predicted nucleic acid-binding protein